jgi:hypothetical protein
MNKHPFGELKRYASRHPLPEFVKSSEVFDPAKKELPRDAYADRLGRQFPVHTKAATWLSHLWYYSDPKAARFGSAVEANLAKAASAWSIADECDALIRNVKEAASRGPSDSDFALIIDYGDGRVVKSLPIGDADQVQKSAADLYAGRSEMPLEWREKAAAAILQRANEYGVSVPDYVEKAAGQGVAAPAALGGSLRVRAHQIQVPEIRERLKKLAAVLLESKENFIYGEPLKKLAHLIDGCDRAGRIHGQYTRGLSTPEELCYGITLTKVAEVVDGTIHLTNGKLLNKEALSGLNSDTFDLLGDDFVKEIDNGAGKVDIEKAASAIRALPMDDANLLVQCLGHEKSAGDEKDRRDTFITVSDRLRGKGEGEKRWQAMQAEAANRLTGAPVDRTTQAVLNQPQAGGKIEGGGEDPVVTAAREGRVDPETEGMTAAGKVRGLRLPQGIEPKFQAGSVAATSAQGLAQARANMATGVDYWSPRAH